MVKMANRHARALGIEPFDVNMPPSELFHKKLGVFRHHPFSEHPDYPGVRAMFASVRMNGIKDKETGKSGTFG